MNLDDAMQAASEQLDTIATPEPGPTETVTTADVAPEPAPKPEARDEKGRFAPKAETPSEKPTAAPKAANGAAPTAPPVGQGKAAGAATLPAPAAESVPPAPSVKAPQSLTPAAREAFAKADPVLQAEIAKREKEVSRTLQETAQARHYVQQVQASLAPYETIARANGTDAMTWAGGALQMAASLYAGTPAQKAQTIARAIAISGVDLEAINAVLSGQPDPKGQPAQPAPDVRSLVEQQFRAVQQQYEAKAADQTLATFLATEPEFIDDVWQDMQAVLQAAASQGRNLTLQQAYDRACKLNDDVQGVVEKRKAAEAQRTATAATAKARAAAGFPRSQPAAAPAAQPKGIDAAMAAAAKKIGWE